MSGTAQLAGMARTMWLAALPALPAAAQPQSLICQSRGYCTNEVRCFEDNARLEVRTLPGDRVSFGWTDSDARFTAPALRKDGMTFYVATDHPASVQTLALGDDLRATMSVSTMFSGELYTSIQVLDCTSSGRK